MQIKDYLLLITKASQRNFNRILVESGQSFTDETDIDFVESENYSKISSAKIKQCYNNSIIVALVSELAYFEGYTIFSELESFPIQHAWNMDKNGNIIDTTIVALNNSLLEKNGKNYKPSKPLEYFGLEIPKEVLHKYLESSQILTPLEFYFRSLTK